MVRTRVLVRRSSEATTRGAGQRSTMTDGLSHSEEGTVDMVDIGEKSTSRRRAIAEGSIALTAGTVEAIRADAVGKSEVLAALRSGADTAF